MNLNHVSFEGKTVVVTGGAQGIGKAIAVQCAEMGGRVVIVDINPSAAAEACREIGDDRAVFYTVDLSDTDRVVEVFQRIAAEQKRVDVLINNAGVVNTDDFDKLTLERWNRVLAVNLTAVFLTCQVMFRHMA